MAEVVGTASAITTFVTLALEGSLVLYQTIQGLQSREKAIRELRQELQALQEVLQTLWESIGNFDVDLASLEKPLIRCKNACEDFNALIKKCTSRSTEERSSKRDWLKLRYMGEDISGFKNMIAGYKSTISIALAYANL
jgi:septal ring factor EnvC (AmiA/AmiB activator)